MIPPPVIDWAVWANLDNYKNTELILLKGHLLLEVLLSEYLSKRLSLTAPQVRKMKFSGKLRTLAATTQAPETLTCALPFVERINRLRNEVAHEPFPEIEPKLVQWAEEVLNTFAVSKHQKYTKRTKITHAFAALARSLYESAQSEA